jgi:tetratricopeptide (TPR) repeat protein
MRNTLREVKIDDARYFEELNFQSSRLLEEIREWLVDPAGFPLVLQGDPGSGRKYCLEAACYSRQLYNRSWTVISVDWEQQYNADPQKLVDWLLKNQRNIRKENLDWLTRISNSFNLSKGPVVGTGWLAVLANLPNILNFAKTIHAEHSAPVKTVSEKDPFAPLRCLLKSVLPDRNLILHIRKADLLDSGAASELRDICETLDDGTGQQHGRLLFACSCSSGTRPVQLLGCRSDQVEIVYVEGLSERNLRRYMDRNFSPNKFDDDLITDLHWFGRATEDNRICSRDQVVLAVDRLLKEKVLIPKGGCWVKNPKKSEEEVNKLIGRPLRKLCKDRIASITPDELREDADKFMELAALCQQWIPAQLLMKHMELSEERIERLVDCLNDVFVDTEPALLIDEGYGYPGFAELCSEQQIAVYRFVSPSLAASRRPKRNPEQKAEELLAFFEKELPENNRAAAALCWQVAEQTRPEIQERWRDRLAWYYEPTMTDRLSDALLARMEAGLVSPGALLDRAAKEEEQQSVYFLQAIICACDRWYEGQGGVPENQEGALFFSLFGVLLGNFGQYEEALAKQEAALEILQRILSADHPHIATSLNNIGLTLKELGRHEEALAKQEAALEIWQRVLSEEHPNIATSLNNIGSTLSKLGRYEEALAKQEAALEIRQRVLPADHPDIAISLNNTGTTLSELGRYEEALVKKEAALEMLQRVLPADHSNITNILNSIGFTLSELGRHEEALVKQEAALEIQQRILPADHPDIALSLNNIGLTLGKLGRHERALVKQEAALEILQQVLPADHPNIATSLSNIGLTLGELGRHEEALVKQEAALEIRQRILPADHPDIALSLNNIGGIYLLDKLERYEEALTRLEAALTIWQRGLPEDHPYIAMCRNNISFVREKLAQNENTPETKGISYSYTSGVDSYENMFVPQNTILSYQQQSSFLEEQEDVAEKGSQYDK